MSSNKASENEKRRNAKVSGMDPTASDTTSSAAARAQVFNALQAEMELADYARGVSGQKVKRVPRDQAPSRTAKRKALREADLVEMAIEAEEDAADGGDAMAKRKRLRGSKVAFQDVVLKSMPLENNDERSNDDRNEMLKEVAELGIELGPEDDFDFEEVDDDDDDDQDEGLDDADDDQDGEVNSSSDIHESGDEQNDKETNPRMTNDRANVSVSKNGLIKRKTTKRVMHRLREFASQRLAEKHGEAIGAHIRGMSETAVQKLREVAKAAPGAPQVYSSLGMVYESMLAEAEGVGDSGTTQEDGDDRTEGKSRLDILQRRMELAHKTYASYHVASLLTKRDFVLWERSGDAAMKVANIYSDIIDYMAKKPISNLGDRRTSMSATNTTMRNQGFDPHAGVGKWRAEQQEWMEHALSAYQSSDNLRPPGVDIPCKLAQVHISLGRYIDALTILTDLRNKARGKVSEQATELKRSDMEGSYPCWLLYADLMMKIGFECKQWNEGMCNNQNYMFKRWIRQNSKDFDWRERRLQALCLALEAAAGSASCGKLIKWMRERADKYIVKNGSDALDVDVNDGNGDNDTGNAKEVTEKDIPIKAPTFEEERERLRTIHKVELQKFDQMTKEMKLIAESHIFNNRIAAREALLDKHRAEMKELALRKYTAEQQKNQENDESGNEYFPNALPLQGSCATVYDIASLLLKQCVELKCFDGGLLAVQSVIDYSRERVTRYERKLGLQRDIENDNNARQDLVQPNFNYDQINFESDDSDDDALETYLSDDDCLEQCGALQMLKLGILPLDIKALHSVCLLGVGGQDYVALTSFEQVIMSGEMTLFNDDDAHPDASSIGNDPQWLTFSKFFKAPVNKSFLLASVAATVTEKSSDYLRSKRVLDIFMKLLRAVDNNQENNNGLDEVLTKSSGLDRVHIVSFLLASLKLMVNCAKVDLAALNGSGTEESRLAEVAANDSIYVLQTLLRFQSTFWNPRYSDWSLPETSSEMVSILSGALANIVQAASFGLDRNLIMLAKAGSMKARHLISTISHADCALSKPTTHTMVETWRTFPLPFHWQTGFHEKVSLRTFNLCVACCVSAFSGWEPSEFNLDQLRSSDGNMFGVTLEGPTVGGFLPNNLASLVAEQWEYISSILPNLETLPFQKYLQEREQLDWYQRVMRNIGKQASKCKIAFYGEEDGIHALLSFSLLCLLVAEESEGDERDELLKNAFSVLLPMTQFCIDKQVWQSKIGTAAISSKNESQLSYYLDEQSTWRGPTKSKQVQALKTPIKPFRLPQPTKVTTSSRRHFQPTRVVKVPVSVLYYMWMNHSTPYERRFAVHDAQLAMKKVDDAMKNLRKSRTLNSLERASLDVSVALVDLAAYDECDNPFVCLQQASIFAGLGSKRGNNDEPFKRFLPLKEKCSPLEALNILGRADCLRAIHFLVEAQYLCAWVASVCKIHRCRQHEYNQWSSSRWRVVGIMTYIVSSTVDETSEALTLDNLGADNTALRKWDIDVLDELERGKSDALALEGNSSQATHVNLPELGGGELNVDRHDRHFEGTMCNINAYPYYTEKISQDLNVGNVNEEDDDDEPYTGVIVGI